ncbi:MAG: uracil-DNA glycosylase [Rhodocyclaceae bacterium]|nr:uracil-DNA glycosylase [Rhodocyclaceae bacterium]MCB1917772.1 uracil-DNA glycosylase [Rhodocyclaceae bacterium]MCP5296764.1 uracil-DNA glycosylase [Zoogloeaceae bacterium]MCW5594932.1 uracil-DNA glycosylase [Rhodocyclaceae bacterium]
MSRRESILREMGLAPLWRQRGRAVREEMSEMAPAAPSPDHAATPAQDARAQRIAGMGWDDLAAAVASCRDCRLCEQRKQAVLGVGDPEADWLFVGEGPGAEEDERGEPFVGQAGKLLDAMLAAIDLKRGRKVYIGNVVKCRPPGNRTPQAEETSACFPYLQRQIELIRPKLIVALGKPAAETLLGTEVKVGAARGRLFDYRGIPLIVTYHPAYLLRNLTDKAKSWEDLCYARKTMANQADGN